VNKQLSISLFICDSAIPNIHSIDKDIAICLQVGNAANKASRTRRQIAGLGRRAAKSRRTLTSQTSPLGKLTMNTKSVLIAALLAAAGSVAFAADVTPVAPATEKAEAVQVAQANPGMRNVAPAARAGSNAVTASCANTYNEATSMIVCNNNDGRSRAQVREETRAWLNSPEGKASRAMYFGGAF
jgi:hypothetical protein